MNRIILPDGSFIWIVEDDPELKRNLMEFEKELKREKDCYGGDVIP